MMNRKGRVTYWS